MSATRSVRPPQRIAPIDARPTSATSAASLRTTEGSIHQPRNRTSFFRREQGGLRSLPLQGQDETDQIVLLAIAEVEAGKLVRTGEADGIAAFAEEGDHGAEGSILAGVHEARLARDAAQGGRAESAFERGTDRARQRAAIPVAE